MDSEEFKDWMRRHRWTVTALARELDVHQSTIQRWRNGSRVPRAVELALPQLEGPTEGGNKT
jgi:transcriptional regulator with XRE-family HTH domain